MSEVVLNRSNVVNYSGTGCHRDSSGATVLSVPCTLLVPGVLNGSQGPLLYTQSEIARNYQAWDGIDVLLGHATQTERRVIGRVTNSRMNGRLTASLVLDCTQIKKLSPGLLVNILTYRKIEVSTGLLTDNEMTPGFYEGREYRAIARNFRPNHLAILEHQTGACSVQDGCGVFNQDSLKENKMANYLDSNASITVSGVRVMTVPNPGCCPSPNNVCVACFQLVLQQLGFTGAPQAAQNQQNTTGHRPMPSDAQSARFAPFGLPTEYVK